METIGTWITVLCGYLLLAVSVGLPIVLGYGTRWNVIIAIVVAQAVIFVMGLLYYWLAGIWGLIPEDYPGHVPGIGLVWVAILVGVGRWLKRREAKPSGKTAPQAFQASELAKVGVDIVDTGSLMLRCRRCGATWFVFRHDDGRLPEGYWHCDNGCNVGG